jgi:hypothetical protein
MKAIEIIDSLIKEENRSLRNQGIQLTIEQKGLWLSLRGIFPPKPYSERTEPHQQSLSPKIHVNSNNIKQARRNIKEAARKARQIWQELLLKTFEWENYLQHRKRQNDFIEKQKKIEEQDTKKTTFKNLLNKFRDYFYSYSDSGNKDRRWKAIESTLRFLDVDEEFSKEKMEEKVLKAISNRKTVESMNQVKKIVKQFLNFLEEETSKE